MFLFDVVGWSDIDKRAISIYEHLNPNHVENSGGDITKLEHLPECDLLTYSSPCTDFSISGLRMGGDKGSGTHSSLIWEIHRLLGDCKKRVVYLSIYYLKMLLDSLWGFQTIFLIGGLKY